MINVDLRRYGTDKEYQQFINGYFSGGDIDETPVECQLVRSVKEMTDDELKDDFYEAKVKTEKIAMLTELKQEIEEKVDNRDFMAKKIQEIIQSKEVKPDDDLQSGYNLCLVDICDSIQQKIDALKGVKEAEKYTQARLEFIRRNSIYGLNFGKDYERLEQEFHCGVEESGGHAYNCNDCPNKCDEYYQWDKEMKE